MKRFGRVKTVYRKELLETLRDRRTLIAMVFVPIVLYPVLMVILVEALKSEAGRQEEQQYVIAVPDEPHARWLRGVLEREDAERARREESARQAAEATGRPPDEVLGALRTRVGSDQIKIEVAEPGRSLWDLVAEKRCHAAVLLDPPPAPDRFADDTNRIVQILYNDTDPLSDVIYSQLNTIFSNEVERIIRARVTALAGSDAALTPLRANVLSVTSPDRQLTKALALIVPFLLVTMTVSGAIYPAIDLTAGERERGTLETLAVSPVPTGQIVAGKFGVIVTIAMVTTALNLASMTAVIHFSHLDQLFTAQRSAPAGEALAVERMIVEHTAPAAEAGRPTQRDYLERRRQLVEHAAERVGFITTAAPIVLISMVPFAVLFGAVMLAVCSFARTFKEAQNYMMPVMMSAIVPAMVVSYMPTIRLEGPILVIPVANIVVLMRELFLGNMEPTAMSICLLSTCFYAVAAVAVAVRVYGNEAVLFSDVGSYKTLLLRRFIKPQPGPSPAFALLTLAVIFPLYFYAQSSLLAPNAGGVRNLVTISLTQAVLFALPVVFLAWYARLNLRATFSLRPPRPRAILAALILVATVTPVSNLLQQIQYWRFPPSETLRALLEQQTSLFGDVPWWALVLVLAVVPGICEELLFRGFLTAGLRRRLSEWKVVLAVGLLFGLFHIYVEKIAIVSLMGVLLTFVCLRTGSIYPAILLHIANNGLHIASAQFEGLRAFYNLPAAADELGRITFDAKTAVFLGLFLIGVALIAASRQRAPAADTPPAEPPPRA